MQDGYHRKIVVEAYQLPSNIKQKLQTVILLQTWCAHDEIHSNLMFGVSVQFFLTH